MITYNTFTWVTAITGVLFYFLVRKDKIVVENDSTVRVSCQTVFDKLSNIHFVPQMNQRIPRVELLSETDDDQRTLSKYLAYEVVPYVGEISFQVDMLSFPHNYTIQSKADVWLGYLRLYLVWELSELSPAECRAKQTQIVLVPLVVKSFVHKQVIAARDESIQRMISLLET